MTAIVIRVIVYFLVAAAVAEVLRFEAAALESGRRFSEFGYNEFTQAGLLLLMIVLLAFYARQRRELAALAVFLCRDEALGVTMEDIQLNAGALW